MPVKDTLACEGERRALAAPPSIFLRQSFDLNGAPTAFSRGAEVFGEGEPAEYLYKVMSGGVRTYNTLSDGRRQIAAFYLPGDIFGLEARAVHSVSAEAIARSKLHAVKKSELLSRAASDLATTNLLLELTTMELQRTQAHILLLLKTARERVVGFLLDMAKREEDMAKREEHDGAIDLRMSRQDIADYLGLTIETVSRTLRRLESASAISLLSSRRIVLRDRPALDQLNV